MSEKFTHGLVGELNADRESRAAFSLVELLVVISIIALLAAFVLPGLSRAREYAYFTSCKNSLRQMGIGVLIYTADNRGALPEGESRCSPESPGWPDGGRKIGDYGDGQWVGWNAQEYGKPADRGGHIVWKLYDHWTWPGDPQRGMHWNGNKGHLYIGRPRLPGKYIPIEIFWCPTLKIRSWKYGQSSPVLGTGSEEERDYLCRRVGVLGYALFYHTTGCYAREVAGYQGHSYPNTWTDRVEWPFRPMTASRMPNAGSNPSVWLAADLVPRGADPWKHRAHFGLSEPVPFDFRFNALHLDGHVHDDIWRDPMSRKGAWLIWGSSNRPYGWPLQGRDLCDTAGTNDRLADEPAISGAFDKNKGQD